MTRDSSGSIVAYGKFYGEEGQFPLTIDNNIGHTAGFPREHLVIAWNSVDFPTLARPTYVECSS
jgi:hypothetical protein